MVPRQQDRVPAQAQLGQPHSHHQARWHECRSIQVGNYTCINQPFRSGNVYFHNADLDQWLALVNCDVNVKNFTKVLSRKLATIYD